MPDHHAVDELSILARWMRKTPEHPALIALDDRDLADAARLVLAVDLNVPFGDAALIDENDETIESPEGVEDENGGAGGG